MLWAWRISVSFCLSGLWLAPRAFSATPPIFTVTTSVGQKLDATASEASLGLETILQGTAAFDWRLRCLLDRPFNVHEKLKLPTAEALLSVPLGPASPAAVFFQASVLDVQNWASEGALGRLALGLQSRWNLGAGFTLDFALAPFVGLNTLTRHSSGTPFSQGGVLEQVTLSGTWQRLRAELMVLVIQDFNGRWRNLYSTFERLSFFITPRLAVGISHQLLGSRVSEATGRWSPIGVFDGRKSRISGFVSWEM